jgi:pyruvate/2-oxoacid:ferredoxin oxidoreductase beta subunit
MSQPERNILKMADLLAREGKSNVLFFNYDNEAFMNTGIQESGGTPPYASTTTGPAGEKIPGKVGVKQDLITPFAFFGSNSLFLATLNPAYPNDFMGKVMEALKTNGSSFLQSYSDCMRGWRHAAEDAVKISKLATDCGYWPLYTVRVKDGVPTFSYYRGLDIDKDKFVEYLKSMGRFRHLFKPKFMEKEIDEIIYYTEQRNQKLKGLIEQFGAEKPVDIYRINRKELEPQAHLHPGHGLCPGCGAGMVLNQMATAATKVAGDNIVYVNNTSCSEVSTSKDNVSSWRVPWVHHLFESGATVADAISTAYKIRKAKGLFEGDVPYIIHIGGDGSTYDIGFQFLKAALIRTSTLVEMHEYLKNQK